MPRRNLFVLLRAVASAVCRSIACLAYIQTFSTLPWRRRTEGSNWAADSSHNAHAACCMVQICLTFSQADCSRDYRIAPPPALDSAAASLIFDTCLRRRSRRWIETLCLEHMSADNNVALLRAEEERRGEGRRKSWHVCTIAMGLQYIVI